MDRDDALTALQDAERQSRAVRAGARWPVTLLSVWGATTIVVEPMFALLADRPWTLVFPMGVMAVFVVWAGVYAAHQRVSARGFARRYVPTVLAWAVLHIGYVMLFTVAELRDPAFVVVAGPAVAAPLFVGAYLESRRS
jgi:hypothetical protein